MSNLAFREARGYRLSLHPAVHYAFQDSGIGIAADMDTGADPNHPVIQSVLLPGYGFTRNEPNGSALTEFTQPASSGNPRVSGQVNKFQFYRSAGTKE